MKKTTYLFLFLCLSLALTGVAFAQSEDGETLAEFDFDNERLPRDLEVTEAWEVTQIRRDVVLHGEPSEDVQLAYLPEGTEWEDYAFEARVRLVDGVIAFISRIPDLSNFCGGYYVFISPSEGSVSLSTLNDQCETSELDSSNFDFPVDDWATVRLETAGEAISFFVDGDLVVSAEDDTYAQGFPLVLLGSESEADLDYIRVVEIEAGGISLPTSNSGKGDALENFAGTPDEAIGELVDLGLIPRGGELVFEEDEAFFSGAGNFFTPLARRSARTNIVMAAELTFEIGDPDELEFCRLLMRVDTDNQGTAVTSINVGFANSGEAIVIDFSREGQDATLLEISQDQFDLRDPHHVLIILMGEEISVYVDGLLVFDRLPVDEREGTYGIALAGAGRSARCEGRNIWVVDLD
jgi:hypothetical protein